jgi:hypothetical protein
MTDIFSLSEAEFLALTPPTPVNLRDLENQEVQVVSPEPTEVIEPEESIPEVEVVDEEPKDYKALYEAVSQPFQANGTTITLNNPEDMVKLMQKGAGYTKTMQDLAPKRKMLMMLEEDKISEQDLTYLLDLNRKNPEAIKKLLVDSKLDIYDIDVDTPATYVAPPSKYTDGYVTLSTNLTELGQTAAGVATLQAIASDWDDASKAHLSTAPHLVHLIHEHKQSGVYDQVLEQINHHTALGNIRAGIPFINSYEYIADYLAKSGELKTSVPVAPPKVVQRVAAPKPVISNTAAAKAAMSSKATSKVATGYTDIMKMSEAEFRKLTPPKPMSLRG